MDFFSAQKKAKQRSLLLFSALLLTITTLTLLTYAIFIIAYIQFFSISLDAFLQAPTQYIKIQHLLFLAVIILFVILFAMFKKWNELKSGGESVAIALGARALLYSTASTKERQALNVVEEMALASGIGGIVLYSLNDSAINAFAAGTEPRNAIVAVTQGAIEQLSRDELQAVIAHEFSHIFHADMKLNAQTSALIFGMVAIADVGRAIFRYAPQSTSRRDRSGKKEASASLYLFAIAIALIIIGYVGNVMGSLIQAAISRKREFLADATAVQYTRYPQALAQALYKIKGESSPPQTQNASLYRHFFFASISSNLFATHPPLDERIRRVDPTFFHSKRREKFQTIKHKRDKTADATSSHESKQQIAYMDFAAVALTDNALHEASKRVKQYDKILQEQLTSPLSAQAILLLLLFDNADEKEFLKVLQKHPLLLKEFMHTQQNLSRETLPTPLDTVMMTLHQLHALSPMQKSAFLALLEELAQIDGIISLHELTIITAITQRLSPISTRRIKLDKQALSIFFSYLAKQNCSTAKEASSALQRLQSNVKIPALQWHETIAPEKIWQAMRHIGAVKSPQAEQLFDATLFLLRYDKQITAQEYQFVRLLALLFDVMIPYTFHTTDA